MPRVTLRDVAEASGVSRSTVSFVLNDAPGQTISPATRERVQRVAEDLGYVPHGIAKALREGTSRIVVLRLTAPNDGNYAHSFIRGLEDELAQNDQVLLVQYGHGSPQSADQVIDAIAPRAVVTFGGAYARGEELADAGGGWDDGLAAHTAIQIGYLADRGHRHLALALPDANAPLAEVRLRYSNLTAQRRGLAPVSTLVVPASSEAAAAAVSRLRSDRPEVTAVAALDDVAALRVLAALRELGLRAPVDLAVIGYDSTEYGALSTPALTTLHIDGEAHGRKMARQVLDLPTSDVALTRAHVIVRDSA